MWQPNWWLGFLGYPIIEVTAPFFHISIVIRMLELHDSNQIQNGLTQAAHPADLESRRTLSVLVCFTDNFSRFILFWTNQCKYF